MVVRIRWCILTSSAIGKVVTVVRMNAGNRARSSLGDKRTVRHASQPSNSVEEVLLNDELQLRGDLLSGGHRRTA